MENETYADGKLIKKTITKYHHEQRIEDIMETYQSNQLVRKTLITYKDGARIQDVIEEYQDGELVKKNIQTVDAITVEKYQHGKRTYAKTFPRKKVN